MKKIIAYLSFIFISIGLLTSCVSDVDFDQTENILPTPVFEANLIFSNIEATRFIDDATQQEVAVITDTTRLEYINSDFFVDQIAKTELSFRLTNSINRNFNIDFMFVNDNNEPRYVAQVDVLAGQPNNPSLIISNFLIEEPELSLFEESTKLIYKITLPPTTSPIDTSQSGFLKLESKSTFYFEL
nr:hypothetical protein [uncultured Psychroserpens sp.]